MNRLVMTVLLIFTADFDLCFSQSIEEDVRQESELESLMGYSDDLPDAFYRMDLNTASAEDLLALPGMNSQFATEIVKYRRRVGFIHDVDELARLDDATPSLISTLKDRCKILEENNFHVGACSFISVTPEKVALYRGEYGDSGARNFQKLDLVYRNFEMHAVTDKDPGEKNYMDFYSLSLAARNLLLHSTLDVGNYSLSLGNGILFANSSVMSKSAGPVAPLFSREAYSLRPYHSCGESRFLRGAALAVPFGNFEMTAFASQKELVVHVNDSGAVTSVDYSGLNLQTENSAPEHKMSERIAGAIMRYESRVASFGISTMLFSYDRPFESYYSSQATAYDFYLRSQIGNLAFCGEALAEKVASFSSNLSLNYDETQFAVGIRDLRSRIIPNYSGVLSESFPTAPEQGAYFGATFRPLDIVKIGFYYDRFRIVSMTADPDRNGEEIYLDSYFDLFREKIFDGTATGIYIRYKYKTKEDFYVPISDYAVARSTLAGSKQNMRIEFRQRFSAAFSISARLEKNFISTGEAGELFSLNSDWKSKQIGFSSGICVYSTPSYSSAFYDAEKNLPGVADFALLYGDGARLSGALSLKFVRTTAIGFKVTRDIFSSGREFSLGSTSKIMPCVTSISVELNYSTD